jgi:hypothetical protein
MSLWVINWEPMLQLEKVLSCPRSNSDDGQDGILQVEASGMGGPSSYFKTEAVLRVLSGWHFFLVLQ